ncbi:hypothetical protein KA005_74570 [bacterium]|nr:hypothetical protein [bacterium]
MNRKIKMLDEEREILGKIITSNPNTIIAVRATEKQGEVNRLLVAAIKQDREEQGIPEIPPTTIGFQPADIRVIRT